MRRLMLAGASLAALSSAPALAQTAAAPPITEAANALQEIVVTAEKREETANKIPMSITAVTAAQMELAGVKQPRDLVKLTPSFSYTDSYVGSPIYTLRGVGFSDISLGGRPTVSLYTDEAPIPFAIETRGANLDLERVEVLKGPQGTLFGQNATGGAINFIDAKPTRSLQGGASVSYGNYNAVDVGGYVSGPISDTLGVRISADHTQNDPWQKSYTTGATNGAGDFTTSRILFTWTPTDQFKAQLNVNGYVDHSDVQAGQLIAITPSIPAAASFVAGLLAYPLAPQNARAADWNPGADYGKHNDFFQSNLRLDYQLPYGLTLTSITSYSRYMEHQLQDIDGTTLSNLNQLTLGKITSTSQELRIAGEIGQNGHFVMGLNYAHDKVLETDFDDNGQSTTAFTFVPFGLPLFTSFRDSDNQDSTTTAIFANADYKLTSDIKVYGGLRYTRAIDKFNGCTADTGDGVTAEDFGVLQNVIRGELGLPANPPIPAGGCVTTNAALVPGLVRSSLNEDNVSWRVGAEWTPLQRTLVYANVSQGYKAGGFPDLAASTATQFDPARQESVLAYEVGFKSTLMERTLQLNGAVFYYDYRDKQILGRVLDPIFGPLLKLVNVPKSEITGAELQLVWAPVRGLTASVGGSYIDSHILDHFTNYDPNGDVTDFNGEAFPNTPKWQLVSDVDYRWDLSDRLKGFVGGDVTYQSATNSQLGDLALLNTKAYALVDLRAGVETKDGAWRASIWGRNVGDVYYWTAANRNLDTTVRFTAMPATYGVTLTYRYK
ncbi:MAG TPA: TonB-dependent receptor [Caulobacteraceae bacterium]|jgi:outer membrane receptor protein involved in Fe transport